MKVGSLFAGIGGFDLAARWMGWHTKWYSEIDDYACKVMQKHFPDAYNVGDVTKWQPIGDDTVDVITGGFPCQPVSVAGKQLGQDDPRWLWPHFARIIRVLRPRYVVIENVPGLYRRGISDVLCDLSACGYDAEWETIPASAVGAPHKRDRVWIIAYPNSKGEPWFAFNEQRTISGPVASNTGCKGLEGRRFTGSAVEGSRQRQRAKSGHHIATGRGNVANTQEFAKRAGLRETEPSPQWRGRPSNDNWWATEPDVGRVAHGIPARVDRLKCLGNAIVPQIAFWIFQQIERRERMK